MVEEKINVELQNLILRSSFPLSDDEELDLFKAREYLQQSCIFAQYDSDTGIHQLKVCFGGYKFLVFVSGKVRFFCIELNDVDVAGELLSYFWRNHLFRFVVKRKNGVEKN